VSFSTTCATQVVAFLTHLAVKENVAASTQNQALSALLFLYREVLHQDLGPVDALRAKRPKRLPTVLTKEETLHLIGCLSSTHQLVAELIYGSGVRLMESLDPRSSVTRRHHLHESSLQKAIKGAARLAGIIKPVGPHTLRHCFATHLLEAHYDIRTVHELLGHKDVKTTMIYTHVHNRGGLVVHSPLD
jgi:site-specific recombinase XerD